MGFTHATEFLHERLSLEKGMSSQNESDRHGSRRGNEADFLSKCIVVRLISLAATLVLRGGEEEKEDSQDDVNRDELHPFEPIAFTVIGDFAQNHNRCDDSNDF